MLYRWHLDLAGAFEATRNRNVWVLVEAARKWVKLVPLRTKEAANTRQAFEERVFARFVAPAEVCTDGGINFGGDFHDLLVEHDIDHQKPLPYHLQPNWLAEGMQASSRYNPYEYGRAPVFPAHAARVIFEQSTVDFYNPERTKTRSIPECDPLYEVNDDGVVVIQGADGDTPRVRVEEMERCTVPYVMIPAGFEDPDMACAECDGRVSTRRNSINIYANCEHAWQKLCHQPPLARVARGAWRCAECDADDAALPAQWISVALAAMTISDNDDSDEEIQDPARLCSRQERRWEHD
eukprot:jgi/Tetstr1/426648/TSEL_016923.t1